MAAASTIQASLLTVERLRPRGCRGGGAAAAEALHGGGDSVAVERSVRRRRGWRGRAHIAEAVVEPQGHRAAAGQGQACPGRHGRRRRTGGRRCLGQGCHGRLSESSHIFSPLSHFGWLFFGSAAAARRASGSGAGRRHRRAGGVVFVVGVEQGRMRAMGMREGAARSEFQAVPAVVTCPQSRSEKKKEGDES